MPFINPNLFQLSGNGVHVAYSIGGIAGQSNLSYQDSLRSKDFSGDQIHTVACDLGTVVSVTIQLTVDAGSTTFSVLIPHMNLNSGEMAQVRTQGIRTLHRLSLVPQLNHGQLDQYTVVPMGGTAQQVAFI